LYNTRDVVIARLTTCNLYAFVVPLKHVSMNVSCRSMWLHVWCDVHIRDKCKKTSLCGRDGRTLCGPQCVIVIR